jgi:two-component sensor histidine kinase
MRFTHSLRSRIVLTLGLVLLPAVVLAIVWIFTHEQTLREAKINNAERAASAMAIQVSEPLRDTLLAGAALDAAADKAPISPDTCDSGLAGFIGAQPNYTAAAIFDGSGLFCSVGATDDAFRRWMSPDRLAAMRQAFSQGAPLILEKLAEDSDDLVAAMQWGRNKEAILLVVVNKSKVISGLATSFMDITHAAAVVDAKGTVLAEWHASDLDQGWLPAAMVDRPGNVTARSRSGDTYRYFKVDLPNTGASLIVGYPEGAFFAAERNILWVALLPPLLMVGAAGIGGLLAVDRLVIQWIVYLQRVTRVYGSGRYSVRALRLTRAPLELAELGYAFNHMADNIAHHATALGTAVTDKERLLRELHHRVKNNFQVIVSLLSLHKQTLAGQQRDDVRFIEDHVNAMAVAYRVGYGYGELADAPVAELLRDTVDGLRRTADLPTNSVLVEVPPVSATIDLDRAIGIGLYLAAMLPAYLDAVHGESSVSAMERSRVKVSAQLVENGLSLAVSVMPPSGAVQLSFLRNRLTRAYVRQLSATELASDDPTERAIFIPLLSSSVEAAATAQTSG